MQYQNDASAPRPPVSTMPTPTQFYAQPAPVGGETEQGYLQTTTENGNSGGRLEPQRRPKYGRFVEVDYT